MTRGRLEWAGLAAVTVLAALSLLLQHGGRQSWPDSADYADAAHHVSAGQGVAVTVANRIGDRPPTGFDWGSLDRPTHASRYGPGYPVALAPFTEVGHYPGDVLAGTKVFAVLFLLAVAAAAVLLGGPWAGVLAVMLTASAPLVRVMSWKVMSDMLAAALVIGVLAALAARRRWSPWVAGLLAGLVVTVRLPLAVVVVAALLAMRGRDRLRVAFGAGVPLAVLAGWQWSAFGAPWRTGYAATMPGMHLVGLHYLTGNVARDTGLLSFNLLAPLWPGWSHLPNLAFYPAVLAGAVWIVAPPGVAVVGAVVAWRRRAIPAYRFTLLASMLILASLVVSFGQAPRYTIPAAAMLTITAVCGLSGRAQRVRATNRPGDRAVTTVDCSSVPSGLCGPSS